MVFELTVIGPDAKRRIGPLTELLKARLDALGMPPEQYLQISLSVDIVNPAMPENVRVCVWCGSKSSSDPNELQYLDETLRLGNPVYPVVESLATPPYATQVPPVLC